MTCKSGFLLNSNTCQASCIEGYFNTGGQCKSCVENCSVCASATTCETCVVGAFK